MAETDEVVLTQKGAIFGGDTAKALNHFLSGLQTFGYNFSVICDTLIQFFQATKIFLESFKNPLTEALIETIDSLIEALEELNNLGFGSVGVYPWLHGTYPQQLNTEKLDEAILGLVAAMEGIDIGDIKFSERGFFVQTKNGETLLTPGQEIASGGTMESFQTKDTVYDCLNGIRNFFHPEMWRGTTTPFWLDSPSDAAKRKAAFTMRGGSGPHQDVDPASLEQHWSGQAADWSKDTLLDTIEFTQKNLLVRELTPKQTVDKIIQSLSGATPDNNRPTGSGPYKAFMLMFALPTINDIIQVLQQFVNYFGSVIGDELVRKIYSANSGTFDERTKTISLGEPLTKYRPNLRRSPANASEYFYELSDFQVKQYKDGTYKVGGIIPMFRPGDRIVQESGILGTHSFTAEVVKHYPIIIKNGMILQNKVKVKGMRGEFMRTNHKPLNSASTPIVRSIITDPPNVLYYPVFRPDTLEKPIEREDGTFFGTINEGDITITEIIPNDTTGQYIRNTMQSTLPSKTDNLNSSATAPVYMKIIDSLLAGPRSNEIISSYMQMIKSIKKGMVIDHEFLQPMDLSDKNFEFYDETWFGGTEFQTNYGKLLDAVPSLDVKFHIANIKIDGEIVENTDLLTPNNLFTFPPSEEDLGPLPKPTMKKLTFEIGFLNYDGTYDTDFLNIDIKGLISPPNNVHSWQTFIPHTDISKTGPPNEPFHLISSNKNVSPNWSYIRISDIFPAYGQVIQEAIGQARRFKKFVENISKSLDEYIKFLERQIKAIQRLNDQIQQLIAFFSMGLNASGIYTAQFSGDGVADFKKKLGGLKAVQTSPNTLNEISLETIETETVVKDPFTGLPKKEKRKVLRPKTIKAEDREQPDGTPKELSELDNLKYSGAIVFFAQGPDMEKFDTFMNNFNGLATLGKGFLSNLYSKESSIYTSLSPSVYDIQGQDENGNFKSIEGLGKINSDGTIRVIFKNEADGLKKTDREMINKQMEKTVDFTPKIQMNSIALTNDDNISVQTKNDSIVLFQGTFDASLTDPFSADCSFHQFYSQPRTSLVGGAIADKKTGKYEPQYFNVDLKPRFGLKRSNLKYKVLVKKSVLSNEGISMKEDYVLETGFSINPVTLESGKLV